MKRLSPAQVEQFAHDGYLAPLDILPPALADQYRDRVFELIDRYGWSLDRRRRHKPHLYLKWASELIHDSRLLDAVEDLLGPQLVVWRSVFFIKPPHDSRYVAWHQDSAYWGLTPPDVLTAWVALSPSTAANGCVRVVPGTHRAPALPHTLGGDRANMLVRGQSVTMAVAEEQTVALELQPGQVSLHHVGLLHGSGANPSPTARIGLAIRFLAGHVAQRGPRQSASLVRGGDRLHHFDPEPVPRCDDDPIALRCHRRSLRRYTMEVVSEALRRPTRGTVMALGRLLLNGIRG